MTFKNCCQDRAHGHGHGQRLISLSLSFRIFFVFLIISLLSDKVQSEPQNTTDVQQQTEQSVPVLRIDLPVTATVLHRVDKRFLSVTLDSFELYRWWKGTDLTNERLRTLTKYLQPAYLRVGGNAADVLEFSSGTPHEPGNTFCSEAGRRHERGNIKCLEQPSDLDDADGGESFRQLPPRKFYGIHLLELDAFVKETKLDLIFGLNVLLRNGTRWDSSNAFEMITFMSKHGISAAGWELGNEPNQFPVRFNKTLHSRFIAKDFSRLRRLLGKFHLYRESLVIGPDTTNPDDTHIGGMKAAKFLRNFLKHADPSSIDSVSFHHYFLNGSASTVDDFLNITTLNSLQDEINLAKSIITREMPEKYVWIGETSTAWGGGAPNISNTFASIFAWLDKLGLSALNGVKVVIRQSLIHKWYGFVDKHGDPTPSYFVSLLFKRFVGDQVLSLHSSLLWLHENKPHANATDQSHNLRSYAHCAKADVYESTAGAVTLYIVNPSNQSFLVLVGGRAGVFIEEYLLEAPHQNLTSTNVNLNGRPLSIDRATNKYPSLQPVVRTGRFRVPSYTVGFWILKYANVEACKM